MSPFARTPIHGGLHDRSGRRVSLGVLLAVNAAVWSLVVAGGASAQRTAPPDRGARPTHPVRS